jgi:tetratricopeptide (TPR) repeat protein
MTASESTGSSPPVPRYWGNVPQRNKNFTGRSDVLEQLRRGAASNITAVVPGDPLPQALQGFGGVGKTAVAIEYAYRYQSEYDLIWWIPAEHVALVRSSLAGLAVALGLEPASSTGIDVTTRAVLEALRLGTPVGRWLLIFDNADRPEDLMPLIPHGPGHVLITSRNHEWQQQVETVPIDVFERNESIEFLAKRVPKGLSKPDADLLAERLGDLPLALVQASAMLAQGGMQVDDYLRLIDEEIAKILMEGTPPEYPAPMTAVWKLSVDSVTKRQPLAQDLLRCCAFFGPEPIPPFVFRRGAQVSGSGISELLSRPMLLSNAIRELGRFALIKIDGTSISVHRLTQALVRAELTDEEQRQYRQEVHSMLAAGAPRSTADRETWPRWAELVAHAGSEITDLSHCKIAEHRALAIKILRYLNNIGDFTTCRSLAMRFIRDWTEASGPNDQYVIDARRHLGNALRELGEYREAYKMIESTLASSENILGPRDPLTLALRNAFGADLRAQGEFSRARKLDLETLKLHEEEFGPEDPQTLRVKNNVALDYGFNSEYEEARKLHEIVYIAQRDAADGVTASEVLSSQIGMARAVRLCGNFAGARDLGEDAYAFGRDELGGEHFLTLRAAIDLSIALRRIPDGREEALDLARQVLELGRRLLGETSPGTIAAAVSLSNNQRTLGQFGDALVLAGESRDNLRRVYGPQHPYSLACTGNLALLHRLLGDPGQARQLDQDAHDGLARRLSESHFYTLTVAANLASDLALLRDFATASALGARTREQLVDLVGEEHPMTLGCSANLVLDMRAVGAKDEADSLFVATKRGYDRVFGEDHPETEQVAAGERLSFDFDPPPI